MKNILVNLKNLVSAKRQKNDPTEPVPPPVSSPCPLGGEGRGEVLSSPPTANKQLTTDTAPECVNRKSKIVNSENPSPLSPLPSVKASNRSPNGKVAQLPAAIRESVNQWINDGIHLDKIAQKLADLGHAGFTHHNISTWKANGFQKWLRH